jgi:DNA sulfur modification protein DndC
MLLAIEAELFALGKGGEHCLISMEELGEIRRIWRLERQDWADTLPALYRRIRGDGADWARDDTPDLDGSAKLLLEQACHTHGVPAELVMRLVDVERRYANLARRRGLFQELAALLSQDWTTETKTEAASPDPPRQLELETCE